MDNFHGLVVPATLAWAAPKEIPLKKHHMGMIFHDQILTWTAQAVAEYGVLQSLSMAFKNIRARIELVIGPGNFKYLVLTVLALIIILTVRAYRKN